MWRCSKVVDERVIETGGSNLAEVTVMECALLNGEYRRVWTLGALHVRAEVALGRLKMEGCEGELRNYWKGTRNWTW